MSGELHPSARRVKSALAERGFDNEVVELPDSTRSALEAAQAVGCRVEQIAKSVVFRSESGGAVLVIASGSNRVDEARVAGLVGEKVGRADADFVRDATGFAIGGVPPLGHTSTLDVLIDEDLLQLDEIWAAAGTPRAVFRLVPQDLEGMTGGRIARIA